MERLGLPPLSNNYIKNELIPKFEAHGFELVENGHMENSEWSKLETTWARRLQTGISRRVTYLVLRKENG
jgi:hypothetical protein